MNKAVAALALALSAGVMSGPGAGRAQAQEGGGPPPAAVRVGLARREAVQERRLITGELRAMRHASVAGHEPGLVTALLVREGQRVAAGEVMARLDTRRLEIHLREIDADTAVARAVLQERQAEVQWRRRDLDLLRSSFEQAAANPRELRDAESAYGIAEARALQAQSQIALNQARSELLRRRLEDATITAPFDGVVVARHVEEGEWYGQGDTIVEMVSTGPIEAWINVPQALLPAVQGRTSTIIVRVDSTGAVYEASGHRIVPQVDPRARTFTLVSTLDNAEGALAGGMSVTAWVPTGQTAEMLTVPSDAILRNDSGPYVYVARGATGPARAVPVMLEVLFAHGRRAVVRSPDLRAGDPVIVEGNERLFPSQAVTFAPVEAEAAPPAALGGGS